MSNRSGGILHLARTVIFGSSCEKIVPVGWASAQQKLLSHTRVQCWATGSCQKAWGT